MPVNKRHSPIKCDVPRLRFSAVLAEFSTRLVENSASTAHFLALGWGEGGVFSCGEGPMVR